MKVRLASGQLGSECVSMMTCLNQQVHGRFAQPSRHERQGRRAQRPTVTSCPVNRCISVRRVVAQGVLITFEITHRSLGNFRAAPRTIVSLPMREYTRPGRGTKRRDRPRKNISPQSRRSSPARRWGERSAAPKPFAGAIGRNTRTPSVTCSRRCRRDRLRARRPRLQTETFRCTLEAHGRRESFSSNNTPRVIRGGWRCRGYGSSGWAGCRPNCLSFSRSVKRERPSQRAALAWLP